MNRRDFLTASASLAAGLPAVGARDNNPPNGRVKIVSSLPRTGSAQGQTDAIVNGIRMAIDQCGGEVAGLKIEYTDLDDATAAAGRWEAEEEANNAKKAIADDDVVAFIGPYNSGAAKVSMPILNEAGLVQISPACTWPGLTKTMPGNEKSGEPDIYRPTKKVTFCRVCPSDDSQPVVAAVFAAKYLKAKTVYVLDDKDLYGRGTALGFVARCKELKIQVLGHESINPSATDFRPLMKKIAARKPDLVYFGGTTQTAGPLIARTLATDGPNCPLLVPDGCYEQAFLEAVGAETFRNRTCYVTIGGVDPNQLTGPGAAFTRAYEAKYRVKSEAYAVYGYEAARVVLAAIETVGKQDREAIRKAVLATKNFDRGALPKWSFDANGDVTPQQCTISKVADGKFVFVQTLDADEPRVRGSKE